MLVSSLSAASLAPPDLSSPNQPLVCFVHGFTCSVHTLCKRDHRISGHLCACLLSPCTMSPKSPCCGGKYHFILLLGVNTSFCLSTDLLTTGVFYSLRLWCTSRPSIALYRLQVGMLVFSFVCHLESEQQLHPLTCTSSKPGEASFLPFPFNITHWLSSSVGWLPANCRDLPASPIPALRW